MPTRPRRARRAASGEAVQLGRQARVETRGHGGRQRSLAERRQRAAYRLELVRGHLGLESAVVHVR